MTTITTKDIERARLNLQGVLHANGLLPEDKVLVFENGWLLYEMAANPQSDGFGLSHCRIGGSYLGETKRQVYEALIERRRIVWDILEALDIKLQHPPEGNVARS